MPQSSEILKMLIESACADGTLVDSDRELLEQKARTLGISQADLNKMITNALGKTPPKGDGIIPDPDPEKHEPENPEPPKTKPEAVITVKKDKDSYIKPLIITVAAMIVTALVCYFIFRNNPPEGNESQDTNNIGEVTPEPPVDAHLVELIQTGEDIFKTKNIARAKALFVNALAEYPDNEELKNRIAKCDLIIKAAAYSALRQVRGTSPSSVPNKLGFADTLGYIVVDFLYDEEIDRQTDIMSLKEDGKYGVIGGDLKETSDFKYLETLWIPSAKHYRLVTDETGAAVLATVQNGKLTIQQH